MDGETHVHLSDCTKLHEVENAMYLGGNLNNETGFKTVIDIEAEENVRDINDDIMLKIGQRVKHEKFGSGIIKHVDGSKVHVDFENHGVKKLISDFLSPC